MKILHVLHQCNFHALRGVEQQVLSLAEHQSKRHEVAIFTSEVIGEHLKQMTTKKQPYSLSMKRWKNIPFHYVIQYQSPQEIPELEDEERKKKVNALFTSLIQKWKPDLVHIHHLKFLSLDLPTLCLEKQIPYIMTLYDYWYLCPNIQMIDYTKEKLSFSTSFDKKKCAWYSGLSKARYEAFLKKTRTILNGSAQITYYSFFVKKIYVQAGIYPEKFSFLQYAFNPDPFLKVQKTPSPKLRFAFIGTFGRHKGCDLILEAWKDIPNATLAWYGSPDANNSVKQYLKGKKIPKGIIFKNEVKQREKIYAEIDCLLVPSVWLEPCPHVMQEAVLTNTPIICSDIPSLYEHLPQEAYTTFTANDSHQLRKCILEEQERKHTKKDRAAFGKQFLDAYTHTESLYQKILKRKRDVSVIIPIKNPGKKLIQGIIALSQQEILPELILIDSSPSQGQREKLIALCTSLHLPLTYLSIPPESFNHGLTRDRASFSSSGKFLAFLTQDAIPANNRWLSSLIANFSKKEVAAVYSRQLPRQETKDIIEITFNKYDYSGKDMKRIQKIQDKAIYENLIPEQKTDVMVFENVSSCIRKDIWIKYQFGDVDFGEDIFFSRRIVEESHTIVYEPESVVYHSHPQTTWYRFRRYFQGGKINYRNIGMQYQKYLSIGIMAYLSKNYNEKVKMFTDPPRVRIALLTLAEVLGGVLGHAYASYQEVNLLPNMRTVPGKREMKTIKGKYLPSLLLSLPKEWKFHTKDFSKIKVFGKNNSSQKVYLQIFDKKKQQYLLTKEIGAKGECEENVSLATPAITCSLCYHMHFDFMEKFSSCIIHKEHPWPVSIATFAYKKEKVKVIMQHPDSGMEFKGIFIPSDPYLEFSIGFDSRTWNAKKGKGVIFEIGIRQGKEEEKVFEHYLDPKNNPQDRRWIKFQLSMEKYTGKKVDMIFKTKAKDVNIYNWAGWKDLQLVTIPTPFRKENNTKKEPLLQKPMLQEKIQDAFYLVQPIAIRKSAKSDIKYRILKRIDKWCIG